MERSSTTSYLVRYCDQRIYRFINVNTAVNLFAQCAHVPVTSVGSNGDHRDFQPPAYILEGIKIFVLKLSEVTQRHVNLG